MISRICEFSSEQKIKHLYTGSCFFGNLYHHLLRAMQKRRDYLLKKTIKEPVKCMYSNSVSLESPLP